VGLYVRRVSNVILRNLKIGQVDADNGDAIGIDESTNVWVDHCDLSGDLSAGKDDLDGLLDITHGAEWVTVSNTYFHDHVRYPQPLPTYSQQKANDRCSGKAP
jgi:pectate lyase